MFNMLAFSFFGLNLIQFVGIIIGLVSFTLLLLFVPISRPIIAVVCCALFFISGIYSCFFSIRYFTLKSAIYGEATEGQHNVTKVLYDGFNSFDFKTFGFQATNITNEYSCKVKFDKTVNLKNKNAFSVNGSMVETIGKDSDYIKSVYGYYFMDDNKAKLVEDKLYITLYTYKDTMELEVKTKGGDNAVKYWRRYLSKNKFVLSLTEESLPNNESFNIDDEIDGDFKVSVTVKFTDRLVKNWKKAFSDAGMGTSSEYPWVTFILNEVNTLNYCSITVGYQDEQKTFEFKALPTVYMLHFVNSSVSVARLAGTTYTIGIEALSVDTPIINWIVEVDLID